MRRWLAVSACGAAVFARAPVARAAEEPPVLLALESCDELDAAEVRRITAAELGAEPVDMDGPDVTKVTVTCDQSRVVIRVHDPLSRKTLQRSFNLGLSDPRARARLVAIAATELVLATWTELQTNPKLHVEPEGPAPAPSTVHAAAQIAREHSFPYVPKLRTWYDDDTPADRSFRIVGLVSMRSFFAHPGTLWGGGLRVGEERFRLLSWSADALLEQGSITGQSGVYDVFTTTLGGALFLSGRAGPVTGRIGAGLRIGIAATSPHGESLGVSTLAPWGWPLGAASISFRVAPTWVIDVSGEAGYVVLPVQPERNIDGGWFSGQLGIGYVPNFSRPAPEVAVEATEE